MYLHVVLKTSFPSTGIQMFLNEMIKRLSRLPCRYTVGNKSRIKYNYIIQQ
uniref:Uncharacterized protein n=1 Tax=Anguilla anguilla TaxID=7936 RepID=A0A0E9VMQ3_ANGAN